MSSTAMFPRSRSVGTALVLGVAFPFVMDSLYRYGGGHIVGSVLAVGNALGLGESAQRAFVLTVSPVCEAALLAIVFGAPLGLLAWRNILGCWLWFVGAVLTMNLLTLLITGSELGWLVTVWAYPATWLNMLAILGVALIASRFRRRSINVAPNAP